MRKNLAFYKFSAVKMKKSVRLKWFQVYGLFIFCENLPCAAKQKEKLFDKKQSKTVESIPAHARGIKDDQSKQRNRFCESIPAHARGIRVKELRALSGMTQESIPAHARGIRELITYATTGIVQYQSPRTYAG